MVPAIPLGACRVRVALSSLLPLWPWAAHCAPLWVLSIPTCCVRDTGVPKGCYPLSLAWRSPRDALIILGVAPLGTPSGSSDL